MSYALAYVHPGWVPHRFMEDVTQTLQTLGLSRIAVRSGPLIARARNHVVQAAIADDEIDGVIFVDTDVTFDFMQVALLLRQLSEDKPIISGLYAGRDEDSQETFPVGHLSDPDGLLRKMTWEDLEEVEGLHPVTAVGMGFTGLHNSVLEKLGVGPLWPFAEYENGHMQPVGEDVGFCLRAWDLGIPSYLDTAIRVGHVREVVL